jgi:uncharacterized Zn finger protein
VKKDETETCRACGYQEQELIKRDDGHYIKCKICGSGERRIYFSQKVENMVAVVDAKRGGVYDLPGHNFFGSFANLGV